MRHLIKSAIAIAAIAAGFAISAPAPAAARSVSVQAACRTDASWHPDGIFFAKQCVRFHRDDTCARYRVITCGGAGNRR
jgi:hypothetical protein